MFCISTLFNFELLLSVKNVNVNENPNENENDNENFNNYELWVMNKDEQSEDQNSCYYKLYFVTSKLFKSTSQYIVLND